MLRKNVTWATLIAPILMVGCATSPDASQTSPGGIALPEPKPAPSKVSTLKDSESDAVSDAEVALLDLWLRSLRKDALARGISATTFDTAVENIRPNASVLRAAEKQPEFVRPIWEYLDSAVSDYRLKRGRELLAIHKDLFDEIEKKYGVDREYLVAIWGMESAFGSFTGDIYAIEALATLGYKGSRSAFGREQTLAALTILDKGYATREQLTGSWAGAMGQTQFIPTTYLTYAVDYDGDGRRDIWTDLKDVFASTANYLARSGWKHDHPWGVEVKLPDGFDYSLAEQTIVKPVSEWQKYGVTPGPGRSFAGLANESGSIILPAGHKGPKFLIFNNFRSILRYNNATAYALAVGSLGERLAGGPAISDTWPRDERPLTQLERKQVQTLLTRLGYQSGTIDGILGAQTRSAVRRYQQDKGLPADGFITQGLLALLKTDAGG